MKRKPLSITIIAISYFLAPILNVARLSWVNGWPLTGPRSVFNHFDTLEWAILLLFPVVGFGVFRVARWGYYLFLGFSLTLVAHNTYTYLSSQAYSVYIIILFHLASFGIVGFFLQKHIITAYFNPKMKWWERHDRYKVNLGARIEFRGARRTCNVLDFSKGGCFVDYRGKLKLGNEIKIYFQLDRIEFQAKAQVMWICDEKPRGIGLMFLDLTNKDKKTVKRILKYLHQAYAKGLQVSEKIRVA